MAQSLPPQTFPPYCTSFSQLLRRYITSDSKAALLYNLRKITLFGVFFKTIWQHFFKQFREVKFVLTA
jgi:hypothetical protein